MAKLLHVGDIHVKSGPNFDDTEQALNQVSQLAREREVDLVLIPGDVFDAASGPQERELFGRFLTSLDCPAVVCRGNHDKPGDLLVYQGYSGVQVCEKPDLIPFGWGDLMVLPWPERAFLAARGYTGEGGLQAAQAALGDLIRTMAATRPQPEKPLVIMGHISVCGALSSSGQPLVGREIQVVSADLDETGAAIICLNHIHKPQLVGEAGHYAGSLTVQDFGEEDEKKGVVLIEIAEDGHAIRDVLPIRCRRWLTVVGYVSDDGAAMDNVPFGRHEDLLGANVRYQYACTEEQSGLFDHAAIERRFSSAHSLKIVPNVSRAQRVRAAEVAGARTAEEKLRAWGQATGTEITEGTVTKLHQLEGGIP
jgi:hypothetical protein